MNKLGKRSAAVLALISLLALSVTPVAAQSDARIRVLHASPDAPAVDIYIDDAMVEGLENVPFGTLSDYMSVPAGSYNVKVFATGTTTGPVIDVDADVAGGMSYTIAAIGAVADIEAAVLEDNPAMDYEMAQVRVVHFSPDAPNVDVAPDGAEAIITDLAFPNTTGYLPLAPGNYDLEVRVTGTDTVAIQLPAVDLVAGRAYSVFAIGSAAEQPLGGNAIDFLLAQDAEVLPDTAAIDDAAAGGIDLTMIALLLGVGAAAFVLFSRMGRSVFARQSVR